MSSKPIIPVMDLMIGQVVLAQGGKRDGYRPVNSRLTRSSCPVDVATAIRQQTGCSTFYLADIDSFAGAEPNWRVYRSLLDSGFGLWIDADWLREGLREERVSEIVGRLGAGPNLKVIVSSETIRTLESIKPIAELQSRGIEPVFSLDLSGQFVLSRSAELSLVTPFEWILQAHAFGIQELIVLDLDRVGTLSGIEEHSGLQSLIQEICNELPQLRVTSGGGVSCVEDAAQLLRAGCEHVLVASAIHECRFAHDDVESLMLLK